MQSDKVKNVRKAAILEWAKAELATAYWSEFCYVTEFPNIYGFSTDELDLYKQYLDDLFEHMMDYSVL